MGIFIPLELIENEELDWINKILLSEIISLNKLKKGCIASNETLSRFLQMEKSSIHRRIKFLVDRGYIKTQNKFSGGKCIGRIITPIEKSMVATNNSMVAHNNTMVATSDRLVAQETINGSTQHHTMVAQSYPMNSFINSCNSEMNTIMKPEMNTEDLIEVGINKLLEKYNIK